MKDRDAIVKELGARMSQAARASVARGAQYEPGELISTDADEHWRGIAGSLVAIIEAAVGEAVTGIRKAIDDQS